MPTSEHAENATDLVHWGDGRVAEANQKAEQAEVLRRLRGMGLEARLMKGGRCVLASMELQPAPFEGPGGNRRIPKVLFSTVGVGRIKCLRPRALFQLPLISIADCSHMRSIEARIRHVWAHSMEELYATQRWLNGIGTNPRPLEEASVLGIPVEGERGAQAILMNRRHVVLPSAGPLSGLTLASPAERLLAIDPGIRAGVDLSIQISNRLGELTRENDLVEHQRRSTALLNESSVQEFSNIDKRQPTLLLAGPNVSRQRKSIESLRLRGYRVLTAKNETEALNVFDASSPELVLADMDLGRADGLDLMLSLRQVYGIEQVPVILVDTTRRQAKRNAARSLGAAGYLVYPLNVPKIADKLSALVAEPDRRRFTRYSNRLSLTLPGSRTSGLLTALSRGGMFVSTSHSLPLHSLHDFELQFPEMDRSLEVRAEVIYQTAGPGRSLGGVGMRFHRFSEAHELILLDYIRGLEEG